MSYGGFGTITWVLFFFFSLCAAQGVYLRSQHVRTSNVASARAANHAAFSVHIVKLVQRMSEELSKVVNVVKIERGVSGTEVNQSGSNDVDSGAGTGSNSQIGDYTIIHTGDDHPFKSRSIVTLRDCGPEVDGDWKVYSKISNKIFSLKHKLRAASVSIAEDSKPLAVCQYHMDDSLPRIYHIQRNQNQSGSQSRTATPGESPDGVRRRARDSPVPHQHMVDSPISLNHIRPRLQQPSLQQSTFTTHDPFQPPSAITPSTVSMNAATFNALQQRSAQQPYLMNISHLQNPSILAHSYGNQIQGSQSSQPLPFQAGLSTQQQQQTPSGPGAWTVPEQYQNQYGAIFSHQPHTVQGYVQPIYHHQQSQQTNQVHQSERLQSYGTPQSAFGPISNLSSSGRAMNHQQLGGLVQIPSTAALQPQIGQTSIAQPPFPNHFDFKGCGPGDGRGEGASGSNSVRNDQRHL